MFLNVLIEAVEAFPTFSNFFALLSDQTGANGPHGCKIFRDDQLSVRELQHIQKGLPHSHIGRHPPLEGDGLSKDFPFPDVALEISCQRITKASHDVIIRCSNLLEMDHVRFGEDAASPCDARGVGRFQSQLTKLFDGEA